MKKQELYSELCVKFFRKEISDEEIKQLNDWLIASIDNKKHFDQISQLWYSKQHNHFDADKAWLKMVNRIRNGGQSKPAKTLTMTRRRFYYWVAAVAIILFMSLPGMYYFLQTQGVFHNIALFEVSAPKGEKATLTLADGTKVWLNSGSALRYSSTFDLRHRKVYLEGEGYFEVAKDESNLFTIVCGETEVVVYGTVFNISNYKDDEFIQLTLVSGKLGFDYTHNEETAILDPSQQLTYSRKNKTINVENTNTELYTIWKDNQLKFDNAPFLDVIKKMERWYDVDIHLEPRMQSIENYTMTVKTESLREILEMLKLTTPFEYRIDKENVYISNTN
ncbi:MAG: FecR family protein [Bacteroidales bacterium]|nr:FecR family protein [Bacteroidales bacterium]MCF8455569.1 FecR family protein [Bacteroidales bacterium]